MFTDSMLASAKQNLPADLLVTLAKMLDFEEISRHEKLHLYRYLHILYTNQINHPEQPNLIYQYMDVENFEEYFKDLKKFLIQKEQEAKQENSSTEEQEVVAAEENE
jgi:hypothetical protein